MWLIIYFRILHVCMISYFPGYLAHLFWKETWSFLLIWHSCLGHGDGVEKDRTSYIWLYDLFYGTWIKSNEPNQIVQIKSSHKTDLGLKLIWNSFYLSWDLIWVKWSGFNCSNQIYSQRGLIWKIVWNGCTLW